MKTSTRTRIFAFCLSLLMVISLLPANAIRANATGGDLTKGRDTLYECPKGCGLTMEWSGQVGHIGEKGSHCLKCNVCDYFAMELHEDPDGDCVCDICEVDVHTLSKVAAKEPTCTEEGYNEHYYCEVCEKRFQDQYGFTVDADAVILPTGHDKADEASYDEENHWYECENGCGAKVDLTAHTMEWIDVINYVDDKGNHGLKCTGCDYEVNEDHIDEDADCSCDICDAGVHNMTKVEAKDPTCTEDGYNEHYYCEDCDGRFLDQYGLDVAPDAVIPSIGHDPAARMTTDSEGHWYECENGCGTKVSFAEHTFELAGHDNHVSANGSHCMECTECGYWSFEKHVDENKDCKCDICKYMSHQMEDVAAKDPTCTEVGLTAGKKCSVCGKVEVAQEEIAKIPHTEAPLAAKAPTCTETGLTEGKKCSVCGEILVAQEEVAKVAHTEAPLAAKAPTCTETGLTEGKKCSVCGEVLAAQKEVAKVAHTEIVVEGKGPTCTETGLTDGKKCSVCGEVLVAQKEIAKSAHAETVVKGKDATCSATGLTDGKKCSVCGEILVAQKEVAKVAHTEAPLAAKAPTCTETGLTEGKKCSVCGEILVAQEEVAKVAHEYKDGKCIYCGAAEPKEDDKVYSYSVVYHSNYGSDPATQYDAENVENTSYSAVVFTADDCSFIRSGYNFKGWSLSNAGAVAYAVGDKINLTAENNKMVLYAVWEKKVTNQYTVTFNPNGGSVSPATKTVVAGDIYGSLPTPEKSGYTFAGWRLVENGVVTGQSITKDSIVKEIGNHELYAMWTANSYTVTFDVNGGNKISTASKTVIFGQAYGALETPTRSDHTFKGWKIYGADKYVTKDTVVATAKDHKLVAIWIDANGNIVGETVAKTGQLNWPVAVMGIAGVSVLAVGLYFILKTRKGKYEV